MLESKIVVINENNEIVQIGAWDTGKIEINEQLIETNPLPNGWQVVRRNMYLDTVTRTWLEEGKLSDKERIKQLEDMIIRLLEVF